MDFLKKIITNTYIQHIFFSVCAVLAFIYIISLSLNLFTRHGSSQSVPNFKGISVDSVMKIADQKSLRIEIVDSLFRVDFPRGSVFEQNPKAGVSVKKNRKIFITINSKNPKKKPLPNVVGYSLRQAKADLNSRGFFIGNLIYVKDVATNNVIGQLYEGAHANEGLLMPMGSEIDLNLGLDSTARRISVPNVAGKQYRQAKELLAENSLNCSLNFDDNVKTMSDSLKSTVYRQEPAARSAVLHGTRVKLFLKMPVQKP